MILATKEAIIATLTLSAPTIMTCAVLDQQRAA